MAKMSEKQLITTIIVITSIVIVAIGGLSYFRYRTWSGIQAQIAAQDKISKDLPKLTAEEKSYKSKIDSAKNVIRLATRILPDTSKADINKFIKLVSDFKNKAGVALPSISMSDDGPVSFRYFTRFEYKLKVRGKLMDFIHFMSLLENHQWFMKVDKFEIKPGPGDQFPVGEHTLKDITMQVSTYTYKEPEPEKEEKTERTK